MTDSMIEKVATAILAKTPVGYGMTQSEANDYARAAIEAMREPTEEMLDVGHIHAGTVDDAYVCFTTMIDAALAEGSSA